MFSILTEASPRAARTGPPFSLDGEGEYVIGRDGVKELVSKTTFPSVTPVVTSEEFCGAQFRETLQVPSHVAYREHAGGRGGAAARLRAPSARLTAGERFPPRTGSPSGVGAEGEGGTDGIPVDPKLPES